MNTNENVTAFEKSKKLNSAKGKEKEKLAVDYLKNTCGYKILKANYTCFVGEIDIIAEDKGVIVFVEVKYSDNLNFGLPRERVDFRKQNKIRQVATFYLKMARKLDCDCRFDVIDIVGDKITHLENCF